MACVLVALRDQVWFRLFDRARRGGGVEGLAPGGGEAVLAGVAFDEAAEIGGGDGAVALAAGTGDEEPLGFVLGLF